MHEHMQTVKSEIYSADTMMACRWYTGTTPLILNLIQNGDEQSTSCPGHFPPKDRMPATHLIRGLVSPRARLDILENRKISCIQQYMNPRLSGPQPSHYTDYATPASIPTLMVLNAES